jgi:hypothetical protein
VVGRGSGEGEWGRIDPEVMSRDSARMVGLESYSSRRLVTVVGGPRAPGLENCRAPSLLLLYFHITIVLFCFFQ